MRMDLENLSMQEIEIVIGQLRQMKMDSYMLAGNSRVYLHVASSPILESEISPLPTLSSEVSETHEIIQNPMEMLAEIGKV